MDFEVKQVCITGDEVISLGFACTDQKFIIFPISTLLCESRLPLGEHTDVSQLVHVARALLRCRMRKGDDIVAADNLAYLS
jgi:hypothetical protein